MSGLRLSLTGRTTVLLSAAFAVEYFVILPIATMLIRGYCYSRLISWIMNQPDAYCGDPRPDNLPEGRPLLTAASVLVALVVSGWLLAGLMLRWALRPVPAMTDTVRQLGPQNLSQRIRLAPGNKELSVLAGAVDEMLDRVAAGFEGQRRFAANASHELRTPLAVQRTLVEVAMDDPEVSADLRRLGRQLLLLNERNERLIEGLLVLAESDRGLPGTVPVRLDEVVASVVETHRELAARHQVAFRQELAPRTVAGDRVLLERLVTNLVQNAVKYNEPGGVVEIVVADEPALTVRNSGERVPAEAVAGLFEPFRRLAADRTNHRDGAGLGLTIVRSIATAHHGTVCAEPGERGGLVVEVSLPGAG